MSKNAKRKLKEYHERHGVLFSVSDILKAQKGFKYSKGDIVGIVGDCMAEFEVMEVKPKNQYVVKCLLLHHPNPEQSAMKIGQLYQTPGSRITVKLR